MSKNVFFIAAIIYIIAMLTFLFLQYNDNRKLKCDDFGTHAHAQKAYSEGETHLDGDNDGVACEYLLNNKF